MRRLAVIACVLAACAQGTSEREGGTDADVDATSVDAMPDAPDACVPADEACNNADDDCDGNIDENLGLGMPCDGASDTDACAEGMIVCDGGGGIMCTDTTGSTVEVCNGIDDDCQNGVDDGFAVNTPCTVGTGACASTGMYQCDAAQTGVVCDAVAGTPSAEYCGDAIDQDCNGADPTCPINDAPAGAIDISAGGTWTADLTTSHDDNFEPSTVFDCGGMGGRDVFYTFTLPAEEVVYWDTFGSNFDSVVRVYAGTCSALGAAQTCSDDACATTRSQGAIDLAAGTYCLVADQFSSSTTNGSLSLTFRRGGRRGVALPSTSGTVTGTTTGSANLSQASCEPNSNQPDVGHFFTTCSGTHTVSADTCAGTPFDSILYVRTGTATSADLVCSDDETGCGTFDARITAAPLTGPNLNWIIVDGFGMTGNGNYSLTYSVQ